MSCRANRVNCRARRQRGVGLVEVLIAVLVLAIGLLGLAGMQMRTLRDNQSASERGVAVMLTHSIIESMRADRTSAGNDQFDIALTAADPTGTTFREQAIATWRTSLRSALGSAAKGGIDCVNTSNVIKCTVDVQWDDSHATGGTTLDLVTEVQL